MKRQLRDLLPRAGDLRQRLRDVLTRSALAGVGLTAAGVTPAQATDLPQSALAPNEVTVVDRAQKAPKLILNLPDGTSYKNLQHRSHSSHKSHSSHSSHYSGSSGRVAPAPAPAPAPRRVVPEAPPASLVAESPETDAPSITGTVDSLNPQARTVTVKPAGIASKFTLVYRDDTIVQPLPGYTVRVDDYTESHDGKLPFAVGGRVQIFWKPSADGKKNIAVKIVKRP